MLLVVLVTSLLAACGARRVAPPDDALTDPAELFGIVAARGEGLDTVRYRATLEYYGDGGRVRVRQAVLARQPTDVRIETISPANTSLAVLVLNADELLFYDVSSETFVAGEPTPEHIGQLAPLWLTPRDIVRVLVGGAPIDEVEADTTGYELQWQRRGGHYELTMPTLDAGELTLDVEHGTWALIGARQHDDDGELVWELRAGGLQSHDVDGEALWLPTRLRFLLPSERVDMSLDVERVDVNPTLSDRLFTLEPPRGIPVTPLR